MRGNLKQIRREISASRREKEHAYLTAEADQIYLEDQLRTLEELISLHDKWCVAPPETVEEINSSHFRTYDGYIIICINSTEEYWGYYGERAPGVIAQFVASTTLEN